MLADEEYERVLSEARQRAAGGEDLDATIAFMRREGFWIIPCIKAVRTLQEPKQRSAGRDAVQAATREPVADLLAPERATLRLPGGATDRRVPRSGGRP